jgi:hypothetical protein
LLSALLLFSYLCALWRRTRQLSRKITLSPGGLEKIIIPHMCAACSAWRCRALRATPARAIAPRAIFSACRACRPAYIRHILWRPLSYHGCCTCAHARHSAYHNISSQVLSLFSLRRLFICRASSHRNIAAVRKAGRKAADLALARGQLPRSLSANIFFCSHSVSHFGEGKLENISSASPFAHICEGAAMHANIAP